MSNCSLKCTILPCIHALKNKNEIDIYESKENIIPCYKNEINIKTEMKNFENTSDSHNMDKQLGDKPDTQVERFIKSDRDAKLKDFNFEEFKSSFQKDKENILINTYSYYFHNNFFSINETGKNEADYINNCYYKRLSLNIMNFAYEKDKQDNRNNSGKLTLFKSDKCNYNQRLFRTASYDDIFLKKIKISSVDKNEQKCIKKYKIPFEPNFYSNRFFFSDKCIDSSFHSSINCTKHCNLFYINNNSVINTNNNTFKNSINHILHILRFEGPPPHFLIIKFNKITKKAVIIKKVPVNKNISFNLAKFIAEKYIQILKKNLKKKEKKKEKMRNNDSNYDNSELLINSYGNNNNNNKFEIEKDNDFNTNNNNMDNSEKILHNDGIFNESYEDDFNSYLLNVDINSLSYDNDISENICDGKIYTNEYLNIDLEKIVFSTNMEKYIKFLNNVKIYFLKKLDDVNNISMNNEDNIKNKLVILVNIKYCSSVKSKIFIFENLEDMKSEYEYIDVLDKKQNEHTLYSMLNKNANDKLNENFNNYKNIPYDSINNDTHINIKINDVNITESSNSDSNKNEYNIHNNNTCDRKYFLNNHGSNTTNENNDNNSHDIYKHEHSDYIFSTDNMHGKVLNKEISDDDTMLRYNSDKSEDDNKNNITLINKGIANLNYPLEGRKNIDDEININSNDGGKDNVNIHKKRKISQKYKRKIINFIYNNVHINSYIYNCFENTDLKNKFFKDDVIIVDASKAQLVNDVPLNIYELNKFVFIKFIKFENYIKKNHKIAEKYIKHLLQSNVKCINNYMIGMRWVPDIFAYEYYVCKITEVNSKMKENKKNLKHSYSLALQKNANKNSVKYLVDYENKVIDNIVCVLHEYYQTSLFTENCIFNLFKLVLLRISMYADVMNKKVITLDLDKALYRMKKFSEPININELCTLSENENASTNKNMEEVGSEDVIKEKNKNNLLKPSSWNNLNKDNKITFEYSNDDIKNKNDNISITYMYNNNNDNNSSDVNKDIEIKHVSDSDIKKSNKTHDKYNQLFIKGKYEKESSLQNKFKNKKKVSYNLDNTSLSLKKKKKKEKDYDLLGEPFCLKYYSSSANNMLMNIENHKKGYYSNTSDFSANSHITKHKYHLRSNNAVSTDNYSSEEYMTRSNLRSRDKGRNKMVYKLMNKNGLIEPYWWFFYNLYTNASVQSDKVDPLKIHKTRHLSKKGEENMNLISNGEKSVKENDNDDYRKILKQYKINLLNHFGTRNNKIKIKYISMIHDIIYKKFILLKNTIFPRYIHEAEILYTLFPHESHIFMFVHTDDNLKYQSQSFLKYVSFSDYIMTYNKVDENKRDMLNDMNKKNDILHIEEYNEAANNKSIDKDFYLDNFIIGDSEDTSNILVENNFKYSCTPNYDKIKRNNREAYFISREMSNAQGVEENNYNIKILLNNVEGVSNISAKNNSNDEKGKNNYAYNSNNESIENKSLENSHKFFDFEKNKREIKQNGYYDYFLNDKNILNETEKFHVGEKRSVSSTNFGRNKYYENIDDEEKKNTSDNDISLIKRRRNGSKRAKSNNISNVKNYNICNKNDVNNEELLIPMGPLPTGVYFDSARKLWRCQWKENGKFKTKGFSLIHYNTLEEARKQCIIYRCDVGNIPVKSEWLNPVYVSSSYFFNKKCASSANNSTNYSNRELKTSSLNLSKLKEKTANVKSFMDGSNKNTNDNYYNSRYSTKNNNTSTNILNNEKSDDIDISILKEFVSKNKENNHSLCVDTEKEIAEMNNINSENHKVKIIKGEKKVLDEDNEEMQIKKNDINIKIEINGISNDEYIKDSSNLNNEKKFENFNKKCMNIYNTPENSYHSEEKSANKELKKNDNSINNEMHSLIKKFTCNDAKEVKLNEAYYSIEKKIKEESDTYNNLVKTKLKFDDNIYVRNSFMSHSDNDNNFNYYNKKKNDQNGCIEYDINFNKEMKKEKSKDFETSLNSVIEKKYSSDTEDKRLNNLKQNNNYRSSNYNKDFTKNYLDNMQHYVNQDVTQNIKRNNNDIDKEEGSNCPEIFFQDIQNFLNFVKEKESASDNTHENQEDSVAYMKKKNLNNTVYENYLKSVIVHYENEEKQKHNISTDNTTNNGSSGDGYDDTTNNNSSSDINKYLLFPKKEENMVSNMDSNKLEKDDIENSLNGSITTTTTFKNRFDYSFLTDKEKSMDFLSYVKRMSSNNKKAINHIEVNNSDTLNKNEEYNSKYDLNENEKNLLTNEFQNNSNTCNEKRNLDDGKEGNKAKIDNLKYIEYLTSEKENRDDALKKKIEHITSKLNYNSNANNDSNNMKDENINYILKKDVTNGEEHTNMDYNKTMEYDNNSALNNIDGNMQSYYKNHDTLNQQKKSVKILDNNNNLISEKKVKGSLENSSHKSLDPDTTKMHNVTTLKNGNHLSESYLSVSNNNNNSSSSSNNNSSNNLEEKLNEYGERNIMNTKKKAKIANNNKDFKKNKEKMDNIDTYNLNEGNNENYYTNNLLINNSLNNHIKNSGSKNGNISENELKNNSPCFNKKKSLDIDINLIKQSLPKGIYYDHAKKLYRVQYIINNSIKTKGFSVKKLGLVQAKIEAESFRNFCLENGLLNSRKRRINSPYNKKEENFKMIKDNEEILSNLLYLYNSNNKPR